MKVALLSTLCGIAIATITEPYESNTTLLEGKRPIEEDLAFVRNQIFSIQIENEHICTGIAYDWGHNVLLTTALCAMKIKDYISSTRKRSSVRVCSEGLSSVEDGCTPVHKVGINEYFLRSDLASYDHQNSALIRINEIIHPERGKGKPDNCVRLETGDELDVVGFEFFKENNEEIMKRRLKYIKTCVIDRGECALLLEVSSSELPYYKSGACIKPCDSNQKFKEGDVGDPVYFSKELYGIIADIGDDTKPVIMIRPSPPHNVYDFSEKLESTKPRKHTSSN